MLTRTWDNRFDWYSVLIVLGGSIFQLSIFMSTSYSFKLCSEANLNIGVSQAIWAINPFLIALLDWLIYGMQLRAHHIIGMSVMILCFVSISLSKLSQDGDESISADEATSEPTKPLWKAVLASMMPPTVVCFFALYIKFVRNNVRLYPYDFTIALWGLMSIALQIGAAIYWTSSEQSEFVLSYWIRGFIGSLFNALGSVFNVACLSTGAPMGPSNALVNS